MLNNHLRAKPQAFKPRAFWIDTDWSLNDLKTEADRQRAEARLKQIIAEIEVQFEQVNTSARPHPSEVEAQTAWRSRAMHALRLKKEVLARVEDLAGMLPAAVPPAEPALDLNAALVGIVREIEPNVYHRAMRVARERGLAA